MNLFPALAGPALLVAAGYVATVVVPATDDVNTTRTAATREFDASEHAGRRIYGANGCVTCHTLQVRDTFTDARLGSRTSGPSDALDEEPAMMGQARYGPDLACIGDRVEGTDDEARKAAVVAHLREPSAAHHGSTMPSYRFLSDADLDHLAAFLVALDCPTEVVE